MKNQPKYRWSSAARTDVGKVRSINEDACLDHPSAGLWVVADGMGGHSAGDYASGSIVSSLRQITEHTKMSDFVNDVEDRLIAVNQQLLAVASQSKQPTTIGSTVVALLALDEYCVCAWVGDSRIYRSRDGQMEQLTTDHSRVEELISQGMLLRENAALHPEANVVTRAVGVHQNLFVELRIEKIMPNDRYLLCSDGLDKEVSDEEISSYLGKGSDCQTICDDLIALTLERGSRDNVTVAAVEFFYVGDNTPQTRHDEATENGKKKLALQAG